MSEPASTTPPAADADRGRRKSRVKKTTKLYAADEKNEAKKGDRVRVVECRPLSKLKRWRLVEVLKH
jgi:small subunit ribosomal protein S17